MSRRLRMGLIGCGIAATREILPPLVSPAGQAAIELVAVCDLVEERARETAARFAVPASYTDHRRMLAEAGLDVAGVVTPIPSHFPIAMDVVDAGKHVYVQKTMTVTVDEATRLVEAARARSVKLVASPGTFLAPTGPFPRRVVEAIQRYLHSGDVGRLAWGRVTMHMRHEDELERGADGYQSVDPSWYYRAGGGPLRDLTVYAMHALTWILGPARRVTALSGILLPDREWQGRKMVVEVDDCTSYLVEFAGGVQLTFNTSFIKGSPVSPTLELIGSRGAIVMGGRGAQGAVELWVQNEDKATYGFGHDLKEALPVDETSYLLGTHILSDILHLAGCILEDKPPLVSGEHACHVIEIIEKAYLAARSGVTQALATTFPWPAPVRE